MGSEWILEVKPERLVDVKNEGKGEVTIDSWLFGFSWLGGGVLYLDGETQGITDVEGQELGAKVSISAR